MQRIKAELNNFNLSVNYIKGNEKNFCRAREREKERSKMNPEDNFENQSISRLATKKQSLDDMYSAPANFLGNFGENM